jgi:hypothetical protein
LFYYYTSEDPTPMPTPAAAPPGKPRELSRAARISKDLPWLNPNAVASAAYPSPVVGVLPDVLRTGFASAFDAILDASRPPQLGQHLLKDAEVRKYRDRFIRAMVEDMEKFEQLERGDTVEPTREDIEYLVFQELLFQQPGVSEAALEALQQRSATWTAGNFEWLLELSAADIEGLTGFDPDIDGEADVELGELALVEHPPSLLAVELPLSFNPLDDTGPFPAECQGVFGNVRNQGACGSCWAQTTAGVPWS